MKNSNFVGQYDDDDDDYDNDYNGGNNMEDSTIHITSFYDFIKHFSPEQRSELISEFSNSIKPTSTPFKSLADFLQRSAREKTLQFIQTSFSILSTGDQLRHLEIGLELLKDAIYSLVTIYNQLSKDACNLTESPEKAQQLQCYFEKLTTPSNSDNMLSSPTVVLKTRVFTREEH